MYGKAVRIGYSPATVMSVVLDIFTGYQKTGKEIFVKTLSQETDR